MFKDFLSKNSRSLLIISVLLGGWLLLYWLNSDQTSTYLKNPCKGQIYIFQEDNFYAPMRLDSLNDSQLFMRNYEFLFSDAIPKREQLLEEEFDLNFFAIYDRSEIERLYAENRLVRIYNN